LRDQRVAGKFGQMIVHQCPRLGGLTRQQQSETRDMPALAGVKTGGKVGCTGDGLSGFGHPAGGHKGSGMGGMAKGKSGVCGDSGGEGLFGTVFGTQEQVQPPVVVVKRRIGGNGNPVAVAVLMGHAGLQFGRKCRFFRNSNKGAG